MSEISHNFGNLVLVGTAPTVSRIHLPLIGFIIEDTLQEQWRVYAFFDS